MSRKHVLKFGRAKRVEMPIEQFMAMPWVCIWHDCLETSPDVLKPGWRKLLVCDCDAIVAIKGSPMLSLDKGTWYRDAVLCPKHVDELENLLKIPHQFERSRAGGEQ